MKKHNKIILGIICFLFLTWIFVYSNVNPKSVSGIKTNDYYSSGMHYIVFSDESGITVINLTKDELECKVLRKQLK